MYVDSLCNFVILTWKLDNQICITNTKPDGLFPFRKYFIVPVLKIKLPFSFKSCLGHIQNKIEKTFTKLELLVWCSKFQPILKQLQKT